MPVCLVWDGTGTILQLPFLPLPLQLYSRGYRLPAGFGLGHKDSYTDHRHQCSVMQLRVMKLSSSLPDQNVTNLRLWSNAINEAHHQTEDGIAASVCSRASCKSCMMTPTTMCDLWIRPDDNNDYLFIYLHGHQGVNKWVCLLVALSSNSSRRRVIWAP